jgi:hypothetical protein
MEKNRNFYINEFNKNIEILENSLISEKNKNIIKVIEILKTKILFLKNKKNKINKLYKKECESILKICMDINQKFLSEVSEKIFNDFDLDNFKIRKTTLTMEDYINLQISNYALDIGLIIKKEYNPNIDIKLDYQYGINEAFFNYKTTLFPYFQKNQNFIQKDKAFKEMWSKEMEIEDFLQSIKTRGDLYVKEKFDLVIIIDNSIYNSVYKELEIIYRKSNKISKEEIITILKIIKKFVIEKNKFS